MKVLNLPIGTSYRLVKGSKEIPPEMFEKTLAELGISDGDVLDLVPRPVGGLILPWDKLQRRLKAEEGELTKINIHFERVYMDTYMKFYRVYSGDLEELHVAVKYLVKLKARGYVLDRGNIESKNEHEASIYVLRNYPYPDEKTGAPLRIFWESDIFHPNIAPGPRYGGTGLVCWKMIKEWGKTFSLASLVKGLQLLVENPNPDDPLSRYPICVAAANFFKDNPHLTGVYKPADLKGPKVVE